MPSVQTRGSVRCCGVSVSHSEWKSGAARMTLSAGSRLGPYEVIAPLGAGGMGEVYRAKDPRLGREVAIKVLTERLVSDREHRARRVMVSATLRSSACLSD